ncbi:glycoside hydrolase family 13 protein [Anaerocolumna aminovalerica]|uniref:Alpha-glucosidase n=1 Tax=Anaerocolumna aminovalerica TaxID=1527 RepID=A0A1I5ITH6_9FIRM|nr:glycoside hydrolase family 13 protein [Anaerocolumna aminovalerica]MBU5334280.1 glycoside hydrolase family 13 protein [Anaerocolumna aminovalerica]SFO63680.1 alpha-glucosidase [Anaerocolumna aminovalerica]
MKGIFLEFMINLDALFSDGTNDYRIPCEPLVNDRVLIRFRAGKDNVDEVFLVAGNEKRGMRKAFCDTLFDYYEGELQLSDERVEYFFEIVGEDEVWFYNREGVVKAVQDNFHFVITPGFITPDWAKGAVFYQIYVDRFFNGDVSNDVLDQEYFYIGEGVKRVTEWSKYPDSFGVREFYGGDLAGIREKLDYLENLGIEVIYMNPIFVSPSNHKYDAQDYDYVDPHFGVICEDGGEVLSQDAYSNRQASKYIKRVTDIRNLEASNELFVKLVEEIHKRGMRVILDGVFNHCGSFHKWLDREGIYEEAGTYANGAFQDKNSPYRSFFKFNEDTWPYNNSYDGWWGHDTLPKLNYEESPKLYQYVMDTAKKWVSPPYNCDGWRLDVAADLGHSPEFNHRFWRDFRRSVKEGNPEALIIAEHYGDPSSWLKGDQWDTVMNYDAFMEPVTWFLTGMEKHSDEYREYLLNNHEAFYQSMKFHMSKYQTSSLLAAMNELSNHDHSRFLTRTNRTVGRTGSAGPKSAEENINKGVFRNAVVIQMTWPGAPTVYYGDEAGVCGWTDPDNRRTYPWGTEDKGLIDFHRDMIRIHKSYEALRTGSIGFLKGNQGFISYGRFNQKDKFIIGVNNNNTEITVSINAWETGITDEDSLATLMVTSEDGHNPEAVIYHTQSGILKLNLRPYSSVVLKNIVRK